MDSKVPAVSDQAGGESFDLSVVVPAINEEGALRQVLPRLREAFTKFGLRGEIIVVDGRSKDGTVAVAQAAGARVLTQTGRGLGGALREGLRAANAPWAFVVDADGSHPPEFMAALWAKRNEADLVIASRYVPGGSAEMGLLRQILSRSLNVVARFVLGLPAHDSSGGFRLYRSDRIRAACADSTACDFTVQQELLVAVLSRGGRVLEVPFRYERRLDGASKASALRLAPAYIRMLFKLRGWRRS
ncbi:MAG: dolichol-phosphate mannosyltransferase [Elusimicrobia bacterium CG11_big_fil_rev_8_21_14_0_20_64_6]|nr:MAG: dolichol-phosphate mannosyltransferase [Elusimicrobia bacterium CG11_big_fil_rev_8_21_14_0_20_64_6]